MIVILDSPGITIGRIVSRCGQIGVTIMQFTAGITIGPFAARLYAVDPSASRR